MYFYRHIRLFILIYYRFNSLLCMPLRYILHSRSPKKGENQVRRCFEFRPRDYSAENLFSYDFGQALRRIRFRASVSKHWEQVRRKPCLFIATFATQSSPVWSSVCQRDTISVSVENIGNSTKSLLDECQACVCIFPNDTHRWGLSRARYVVVRNLAICSVYTIEQTRAASSTFYGN